MDSYKRRHFWDVMTKILLIYPPWYRFFKGELNAYPIGLCYIAGVLEKHGFDKVRVYNADYQDGNRFISQTEMSKLYDEYLNILKNINHPIWKEIGKKISTQKPDIVGISVMTGKLGSALNVARIIKDFDKDIPVVFGGPHPTILPEETLKNEVVDIVVRGEGEYTFLEIVKNIESDELRKVLGITYKDDNNKIIHNPDRPLIQNLDELPFPARHLLLDLDKYRPIAFGSLFATRGCPYNCIFCASYKIWTKKVRYRSPENVIDEIMYVQKEFKVKNIYFEDDSFTLNSKWTNKLCDLMINEQLNINWGCETRADHVTEDLIGKMKNAGCRYINIGFESGDEETLKKIKKGITIEQIKTATDIILRNNMNLNAFFIIGFPWETKKEIGKTIALLKELNIDSPIYSIATPYPGTELYEICKSEGLIPENVDWSTFFHQSPNMFFSKCLSKNETLQLIQEVEQEIHGLEIKRLRQKLYSFYYIKRIFEYKLYKKPIFILNFFYRKLLK